MPKGPGKRALGGVRALFSKSLRLPLAFFKSPCKIRISSRQDASNRREKIKCAGVAQLVEQRIRNAKVGCSNPLTGTTYLLVKRKAKMPQSPRALRFFCCLKFFKAPAPQFACTDLQERSDALPIISDVQSSSHGRRALRSRGTQTCLNCFQALSFFVFAAALASARISKSRSQR